jgi:outer membrane biogenesis lipoprotein LolB
MRLPAYLAVLCLLAACSQPTPPPPAKDRDQALQRTIEEPLQRAKAVEADVLKAQQRVDEQLDAQQGRDQQRGDDQD